MKKLVLVCVAVAVGSVHAQEVILGPPPTRFDRIQNYDYINQRPTKVQPSVQVPMAKPAEKTPSPMVPPIQRERPYTPPAAATYTPPAAPSLPAATKTSPAAPVTATVPSIPKATTQSPTQMQVKTAPEQGIYSAGARTQVQAPTQQDVPQANNMAGVEESMMMDPSAAYQQDADVATMKSDTATTEDSLAPNQAPADFQQLDQMPDEANAPTVTPQVFVTVNKSNQTITIESPEGIVTEGNITADVPWGKKWTAMDWKVSTGGGLKRPKGKNAKGPYCANDDTPNIPGRSIPGQLINGERWLWIPAIEMDENFQIWTYGLNGPGSRELTPKAIPKMTRVHYSNTFEDENGNTVPMQDAIRIHGGIFFHRALDSYMKYLGQNVSGGCIRLSTRTAKLLYGNYDSYHDRKGRVVTNGNKPTLGLMKKYGGIAVRIVGDNPPMKAGSRSYCTPQMVAHVRNQEKDAEIRGTKFSAGGSISDFFSSIFGGNSNSGKKAKKRKSTGGFKNAFGF